MLKPDPTRSPGVVHSRVSGPEWVEADTGESTPEPGEPLAFHRPEELPADLALDLRLHEMLEQALVATSATGAVIALASGDQMVCRATAGAKSPKTGVYLNTHSGLSGLCILSHEMQLCDDTLADSRVNAAACRELEIRSIVVLPVLDGEKLWGILEVFSSAPRAFSDPDVQRLRTLCRRISRTVHEAEEGKTGAPIPDVSSTTPSKADAASAELMASEIFRAPAQPVAVSKPRDYRTSALTAAVIGLALLLGWMVGRVGWSMALNRAQTHLPMAPEEAQAAVQVAPTTMPASPPGKEVADTITPAQSTPAPPASSKPVSKPKMQLVEPPGELVVYENGKVVFRMAPTVKPRSSGGVSDSVQTAMARAADSSAAGEITTQADVIERVEPEYPEDAKQHHIEGPVVLEAMVNADGSVREVKVVSGDPQLVKAAADAVRQWRFKPHLLKGQPVEFETRITVDFQLP